MSTLARRVVSLTLMFALILMQSSASISSATSQNKPNVSSVNPLIALRGEAAAMFSNAWLRASTFVPFQTSPTLDDLRANTPSLPNTPSNTNVAPPSGYDDPKPTTTANFATYYSQASTRNEATGIAGNKALQTADPTAGAAAVGGISLNLDSGNFSFSAPLLGLGGRAGLGLSLGLTYNSRVWTTGGTGWNAPMAFNADKGFPGPGWRLGFGAIQGVNNSGNIGAFTSATTTKASFLYIAPDGTKRELSLNTTTGLYESYDSSWLDFNASTKVLRTIDGTKITFGDTSTASGDYQWLPTEIKNRQGNFITVVYKTLTNNDRVIDYVTDTAGRRIDFYYESNRLRDIRQNRNGTIFKYATIDYQPVTMNATFDFNTTDPANINGQQVYVPTRITYPTGINYRFYYTSFAQMWLIEKWVPGITGQGAERRIAYTRLPMSSVNAISYPANAQAAAALTGFTSATIIPRSRWDWAENWNNGNETWTTIAYEVDGGGYNDAVYGYHYRKSVTAPIGTYSFYDNFRFEVPDPDNPPTNGNTPHQKIVQPGKGAEITYERDANVTWLANARPTQTKIVDTINNTRITNIAYATIDGILLPTQVEEKNNDWDTVYRRTTTTYTSYPTQRILGLPLQISTYEGAGTKLVSRVTNSYDQSGTFTDSNALALNYLIDESGAQVIQHDNTNYGVSLTQRGNLTSVTQSGVNNSGTVTGTRVIKRSGYDTNGNLRWTADGAGNRAQVLYTDNFLNKPAGLGNTQAYPYTAADPTGMRSGSQADYWTGNVLKTFSLKPNSSTEEQIVTTTYDWADRPFQTMQPTGAWVKTFFWDNLLYATTLSKTDTVNGVDQIGFSFARSDGAGRTLGKGSDHPNAVAGKYSGQQFVYNDKGQQKDQSNVTAMNASWTAIDEDAAAGWLYQNYQYEERGRIKQITLTDGGLLQNDYLGCGCAGATVTSTDAGGYKTRSESDYLGRLKKAGEYTMLDGYGNPAYYNTANYSYDVLDRLLQIDVKAGNNGTPTQTRTFGYDDYGRLSSETTPEAGTVSYTYTPNDQVKTKTDARGKITTMNYNTRNLIKDISYNDSTPGASYEYDDYGARITMTDGEGTMSYGFDTNRRLQSETRTFTALTGQTFSLNYTFNPAGQLKKVNYASSAGLNKNVNYAYNTIGGLTSVGTNLIGTDPDAKTNVLSNLTYNGFGAVTNANYGNGRRLTTTYSANRHQMLTMKVDKQDGTDSIIDKAYQYTKAVYQNGNYAWVNDGRIHKITDNLDANYTTNYTYDETYRLSEASSPAFTRGYAYDQWGNLKSYGSSQMNNATTVYNLPTNASGAPATNRMSSVTLPNNSTVNYGWDAAGNMTSEGATTYEFDAAGRMKSVNNGTSGSYGFDGNSKRVKKTEGGQTVYYVESIILGKTAFEVTSTGLNRALVNAMWKTIALLATDGQFYWTHADHLGTGRKLTATNGTVAYRGEFDAHGNALLETGSTTLNNRKFTGYERDASGLDYAQARMYEGTRGRFTSPDPAGSHAAKNNSPESFNRYAYASNDPVNLSDPNGEFSIDLRFFFNSICGGSGSIYTDSFMAIGRVFCGTAAEKITKDILQALGENKNDQRKLVDEYRISWEYGTTVDNSDGVGCGRIGLFKVEKNGVLVTTATANESNQVISLEPSDLRSFIPIRNTNNNDQSGIIFRDQQGFAFSRKDMDINGLIEKLNGRPLIGKTRTVFSFSDKGTRFGDIVINTESFLRFYTDPDSGKPKQICDAEIDAAKGSRRFIIAD